MSFSKNGSRKLAWQPPQVKSLSLSATAHGSATGNDGGGNDKDNSSTGNPDTGSTMSGGGS